MPKERFFIDSPLENSLFLEGTELHHLAHVMRIRVGEEVELVNGKGSLAVAKLTNLTKNKAALEVLSVTTIEPSKSGITLALPFMRPAKLEWTLEKCTELGADKFLLYPAAHSEKGDVSEHQLQRFYHIAISAMKQCGRLDLPPIEILPSFDALFKIPGLHLFGDTQTKNQDLPKEKPALFITGPEKGFSEKEAKLLKEKGRGVSLHHNILRAETAPLVALILLTN